MMESLMEKRSRLSFLFVCGVFRVFFFLRELKESSSLVNGFILIPALLAPLGVFSSPSKLQDPKRNLTDASEIRIEDECKTVEGAGRPGQMRN